jgi:trehalose 6-phosphate phosphatase
MKRILSQSNVDVLREFARSKVLLAFDFDGTLAPIVEDPAEAHMRASTEKRLVKVARRYPCVVISGRAQRDIQDRLRGVPVADTLGNHGVAPGSDQVRYPAALLAKVRGWVPRLTRRLAGVKGVKIEDKQVSLAIHYRQSRQKRQAVQAIERALVGLADARIIRGKLVFNLLPEGAPHKGLALRAARERLGCDTAIYVGDDASDEDVFALDEPGRLLTVRVEEDSSSHATYFLRDQDEIDEMLDVLLACRASKDGSGASPSAVNRAA